MTTRQGCVGMNGGFGGDEFTPSDCLQITPQSPQEQQMAFSKALSVAKKLSPSTLGHDSMSMLVR